MKVKINNIYKPLYTSKKRYFILTGGRGSGKTFAVQDFLIRLLEQVGQSILYTRYTMTSVEKTIIPLFTKHIELISDLKKYTITKKLITNNITGSTIMFSGIKTSSGDQTGNLKTLPNITTWVIEEGEDYNKESSFIDIDDSIRTKGIQNRIIWIQNPTTKEHFIYKKFFENSHVLKPLHGFSYQQSTHPDVEHIHTTYHINKANLDAKKVAQWEQIRVKNPKKYKHKYIGAWLDKAEGVIFEDWQEGVFDDSLAYCYGQDFGFSVDPTTLIKIAIDKKNKKMYWHEEAYTSQSLGTTDIYNLNISRIKDKNALIIADSAEGRLISDLRKMGLNIRECKKGPGSVRAGLVAMQDYIHIISPESVNIKKEFNNYIWNDKKAGIAVDDFNHAIDAGRYAFTELTNKSGIVAAKRKRRK